MTTPNVSSSASAPSSSVDELAGKRHLFHFISALFEQPNHALFSQHVTRPHHDECRFLSLEELFGRIRHTQITVLHHRLGKLYRVRWLILQDLFKLRSVAV